MVTHRALGLERGAQCRSWKQGRGRDQLPTLVPVAVLQTL